MPTPNTAHWTRLFLTSIILTATGCRIQTTGDDPGGDTWLPHNGGTVCNGADASPVPGNDVWVSPGGSDTNAGNSADAPFATLARALCSAAPGQTVHVGSGTYTESVLLSEYGDPSRPITISGAVGSDGTLPVLDGERNLTVGIAILGEDEEHPSYNFVVENIEFINYTDIGLLAAIANDVTFRNCRAHDNGFHSIDPDSRGEGYGIAAVDVNTLLVDGVESYANGPEPALQQQGILGTGLDIFGCRDVIVRNAHLHDGIGGGLLLEDCVNALAENNEIANNFLDGTDGYWDGGAWVDGGSDITIRNNTFRGNHGPGLVVSDEGVQRPTGYVVQDNTFTENLWGIYIWNFGACPWPDASVVQASGNTYTDNSRGDHRCAEWECGLNQPCD